MFSLGNPKIYLQRGGRRTNMDVNNLLREACLSLQPFSLICLFICLMVSSVPPVVITCQPLTECQSQTFISHSSLHCVVSLSLIHSPLCFPSHCLVDRLRTLSDERCECTCVYVVMSVCVCVPCVYSLVSDGCVCGR